MTRNPIVGIILLLLAAWVYASGGTMALPSIPWLPVPSVLVSEGPRNIFIIRETEDSTPAIANVVTGMRVGAADAYLTSKGHTLWILDDDTTDPSGTPSQVVQQWIAKLEGLPLPVLIVADKENKLLSKQPLPKTVDEVLAAIRTAGG